MAFIQHITIIFIAYLGNRDMVNHFYCQLIVQYLVCFAFLVFLRLSWDVWLLWWFFSCCLGKKMSAIIGLQNQETKLDFRASQDWVLNIHWRHQVMNTQLDYLLHWWPVDVLLLCVHIYVFHTVSEKYFKIDATLSQT